MANFSGLIGAAGGANGTGFAGPTGAQIVQPTTKNQAQQGYDAAQGGLNAQNAFLQAVQPGGIQALGSQSQLLGQLQNQANGVGPNPAMTQLAQTTGQNTSNQAALMAGQRGTNANVGLMGRQIAMQGAQNQQNAVGQAATLGAQQQLAARQQLQAQQQAMVGQQSNATNSFGTATQNEQSNLLNSINAQNNANVGMQSNLNNANAGLVGQTMGQQASIGSSMSSAMGSMMAMAEGGKVQHFDDGGQVTSNGGVQAGSAPNIGSVQMSPMPKAYGGMMAQGGPVANIAPMAQLSSSAAGGPASNVGQYFANPQAFSAVQTGSAPNVGSVEMSAIPNQGYNPKKSDDSDKSKGDAESDGGGSGAGWEMGGSMAGGAGDSMGDIGGGGAMMAAHGGRVPALVSPGEQYLPPKEVKKVAKGEKSPLKAGERIPGIPKHPGNDYRNDVVPKTLQEGGIVIPNAVMQSKDPHKAAIAFVHATIAKNGKGLPKRGK